MQKDVQHRLSVSQKQPNTYVELSMTYQHITLQYCNIKVQKPVAMMSEDVICFSSFTSNIQFLCRLSLSDRHREPIFITSNRRGTINDHQEKCNTGESWNVMQLLTFSRSSNIQKRGVIAPLSSAWVATLIRWFARRVSSENSTTSNT